MIGVKSTALLFAENTKRWLTLFYGVMVALMAVSFWPGRRQLARLCSADIGHCPYGVADPHSRYQQFRSVPLALPFKHANRLDSFRWFARQHLAMTKKRAAPVKDVGITLKFEPLAGDYAICKLPADAVVPPWANQISEGFVSISRAEDELSIVCRSAHVPDWCLRGAAVGRR